eukprot:scaffold367_cov254-Pinguiococcus_pyrenoidosus.AAC.25
MPPRQARPAATGRDEGCAKATHPATEDASSGHTINSRGRSTAAVPIAAAIAAAAATAAAAAAAGVFGWKRRQKHSPQDAWQRTRPGAPSTQVPFVDGRSRSTTLRPSRYCLRLGSGPGRPSDR